MNELNELFPAHELDELNFKDKKQKAIELALEKEFSQKVIAEHFGFDYKSFNRWVNQSNKNAISKPAKMAKQNNNKHSFKPADSPDDESNFNFEIDYAVDDAIKFLKANLYRYSMFATPSNIKGLCDSAKVLSELEKGRGTGMQKDEELLIKLFGLESELNDSMDDAVDASEMSQIDLNEPDEG